MTTPYGTTSFASGGGTGTNGTQVFRYSSIETTYPDGEKDRVEYSESTGVGTPMGDPAKTVPKGMRVGNEFLAYRNTYYWDRNAFHPYEANPNDYTKARLYHWLHLAGTDTTVSGVLESQKNPLENRVWFSYPGQADPIHVGTSSSPSAIGRVLDDGSTQLYQLGYNALGRITNSIDPIGRQMTCVYATNLVDLLEVHQTTGTNNELVASLVYNSQHRPAVIRDAAAQMTTNTYNACGQMLTTTDPLGETTTFNYDTNGYLLSIDGPLPGTNDVVSFTYDFVGRVRTVTGTDGYTLAFGYDNADRLTNTTYPDGTFQTFAYSNLDLVTSQDRLGRKTQYTYDSLRRLISSQDPLNRITRFEYCGCGALAALIDPMGRRTSWEHDIQGRLSAKQYADGSRMTYNYENTASRLKYIEDERGQFKVYSYSVDDTLAQISYPNAQIATPTVNLTYDPNYNRLTQMQDGIGITTWSYFPPGALGALGISEVDGPWPNEAVSYQYDALRRVAMRVINGIAETHAYDSLGRVSNSTNALGSFKYDYDGATPRLLDAFYPNGQTSHYDYFENLGDRRLERITHTKPDASLISRFTYAYDTVGNITNWMQEMSVLTETWGIGYDSAGQLLSVVDNEGGTNTLTYHYVYDPGGNLLLETSNGAQRGFHYNALNELVASSEPSLTNLTYEWDAERRLSAVNIGAQRSEYSYEGLGRRTMITKKVDGAIQCANKYVWAGARLSQELNSNGATAKLFFDTGEQHSGTNLYYTRDHLGSIRGIVDQIGSVQTDISYGPYGCGMNLDGGIEPSFGYCGYFVDRSSGLLFPRYRAYNAALARWIVRDLMGEIAGDNLYVYADNSPVVKNDPVGALPTVARGNAAQFQSCMDAADQQALMCLEANPVTDPTTGVSICVSLRRNPVQTLFSIAGVRVGKCGFFQLMDYEHCAAGFGLFDAYIPAIADLPGFGLIRPPYFPANPFNPQRRIPSINDVNPQNYINQPGPRFLK
jgi:RHS repeat-associated protein